MRKTNKNRTQGMVLGMCFGSAIGIALGQIFNNISIGLMLGLCLGMSIGLAIGVQKDNEVNKQIEEKGYTIKMIEKNEKKEYTIVIVNKLGENTVVTMPEEQVDGESFAVGDVVFLDDDGSIEQAYDKEDK